MGHRGEIRAVGLQHKILQSHLLDRLRQQALFVGHNAAHAKELADLAVQLQKMGNRVAYEQVMAAVSDFEKGNLRLGVVLASLEVK